MAFGRTLSTFPLLLLLLAPSPFVSSFQQPQPLASSRHHSNHDNSPALLSRQRPLVAKATSTDDDTKIMKSDVDEYRNGVTAFLSNFMQKSTTTNTEEENTDPLSDIDFQSPKAPKMSLEKLASVLDAELYEKEWFVTGRVNPVYFDDGFQFQDPDVKLTGVEEYARGVIKIFDQSTSRAQIISTVVNTTIPNTITVTWRLSGKVNIGPGLTIKPYICYTDFTVDETSGLIVFQEDRFDIPGWDILLSALFPFLVGKVGFLKEAAEEVPPRVVSVGDAGGKEEGIFGGFFQKLGL